MIREEWSIAVKEWAEATPQISKVYFVGSRAKGTSSPESDLDIAITLIPGCGYGDWICFSDDWEGQLKRRLKEVEPHLCRGTANLGNPLVAQAIAENSVLVFDRNAME